MTERRETIYQFIAIHKANAKKDGQRLGQRFVNMYIKDPWPELFYAPDIDATILIHEWLTNNSYLEELPRPLTEQAS
jgi:hypothetical protein